MNLRMYEKVHMKLHLELQFPNTVVLTSSSTNFKSKFGKLGVHVEALDVEFPIKKNYNSKYHSGSKDIEKRVRKCHFSTSFLKPF